MNRNHEPPDQTANERTAARIRGLMAEQRRTAHELGEVLGISRQAAGRKIGGGTKLTVEDLDKIAGWLNRDTKDLLG